MINRAYEKLLAEEGVEPREEANILTVLFAQMEQVVRQLPGVIFYHLQPGEIGHFGKMEWNAWLYVREADRVFPFRVAIEPGRHTQFKLKVHPDRVQLTDITILSALRDVMREQMSGVDAMYLRLRYWNETKDEPVGGPRRGN